MDILKYALGFMDSQIVLTAHAVGLFDLLDESPKNSDSISKKTGMPEESVSRLLTALCGLNLIAKTPEGSFENNPKAANQLVRGRPGYIGSLFTYIQKHLYPAWSRFGDTLQNGGPIWEAFEDGQIPHDRLLRNPEALGCFLEGMHTITQEAALEFIEEAPELGEIRTLADLGGASGALVLALAKAHVNLRAVVYDLPQLEPAANSLFEKNGLTERLRFQSGDFWKDDLPADMDAYSLGFILHDWGTEKGSLLLQKISNISHPGTWLIIGEYLFNDDRTGPLWVARSDLNMLVAARGRERSAIEYGAWIAKYGFHLKKVYRTSKGKSFLIARKVSND